MDATRVQVGQGASIRLDALPERRLHGRVSAPTRAAKTGSWVVIFTADIDLLRTDSVVRWGKSAFVNITPAERDALAG